MIVLVLALLAGVAALGLTACTGLSCTRNTDCPSPLVCNMYGLCDDKPVPMPSSGDGGSCDSDGGDGGCTTSSSAADGGTTPADSGSAADAAPMSDGLLP
jgi:hypothetical protein